MKKKEIDILYERKAKADAMYMEDADRIPIKQMGVYLEITNKIHILEDIKFMIGISPQSMNPDKYQTHMAYVMKYVRKLCFNEALKKFYLSREVEIRNFIPKEVGDYKRMISSFILDFYNLWNCESEKNKK